MKLNFYTDNYDVTANQSGTTNKSITVNYNCSTNCNKTVTINQGDQIFPVVGYYCLIGCTFGTAMDTASNIKAQDF